MFDFAFSAMLLAALVALVVLGPERLPQAARGKVSTHKALYKKQPECSVFGLLFMIL